MNRALPKHSQVFVTLRREIEEGRWPPGRRLPGEAALTGRFEVSRITISRAMRDLQAAGLVERRPGSGTYVKSRSGDSHTFGLLIPEPGETEIFDPIFRGMMAAPQADRHALVLGHAGRGGADGGGPDRGRAALNLCRQYIGRRVSGVFFAPLEHVPGQDEINERIAAALDRARIPVVLLDRPLRPFPAPSRHDLVGIDNRRAGYLIGDHLFRRGCRRVHFAGLAGAASTVDDREAGFREALHVHGASLVSGIAHRIPPGGLDEAATRMMAARADGVACANDRLAGALMHAFARLGCRVPDDVKLVGIDDVEYAGLLPVPLTTLRQPARGIGETALAMMLERIAYPALPVRDVRLECALVVRDSCGGADGQALESGI